MKLNHRSYGVVQVGTAISAVCFVRMWMLLSAVNSNKLYDN